MCVAFDGQNFKSSSSSKVSKERGGGPPFVDELPLSRYTTQQNFGNAKNALKDLYREDETRAHAREHRSRRRRRKRRRKRDKSDNVAVLPARAGVSGIEDVSRDANGREGPGRRRNRS